MSRVQLAWANHQNIIASEAVKGKEIPHYDEFNENKPEEKSPSYLERILSMTTDVDKVTVAEDLTDAKEPVQWSGVVETKEDAPKEISEQKDDEMAKDHKELINSRFKWQISRDFGTYDVTHFDRPIESDRLFDEILNSVLEENIPERETNRNTLSNKKKLSMLKPSPRSPTSTRSISPTNVKIKGPRITDVNQSHRPIPMFHVDWLLPQNFSRPNSQTSHLKDGPKKHVTAKRKKSQHKKFNISDVKRKIEEILKEYLADKSYDAEHFKNHITNLTDTIKSKVKHFYGPRYRLICIVNIIENKKQGFRSASRCCWDSEKDNFVEVYFEEDQFMATCVLYSVYLE